MFQNELPQNNIKILKKIPALIKKTFPIPERYKKELPSDIAELSRLLTKKRGERSLSYLSRPNFLNAYLYYFLPWNLYRLCLLLPNLNITLSPGGIITDLGCGPLTFTAALWISLPETRNIPLEINCIDRSGPALEAGKKFFTALCETENNNVNWKINLIKDDIDLRKTNMASSARNTANIKKNTRASLVCAVNLYNEIYENLSHNNTEGLRWIAVNAAGFMHNQAAENAFILTVEPGVPQSGRFISFLRDSLIELNRPPASPCTHTSPCPLSPGTQINNNKKRWCHFAYKIANIPKELNDLSLSAGLPKERLTFSFLLAGRAETPQKSGQTEKARIISDAFTLPDNQFGCYGCSAKGLILLKSDKHSKENLSSGDLVTPIFDKNGQRDKKSGALTAYLAGEK